MLSHVFGYALFGVAARSYALGLQRRPVFSFPQWHVVAGAIGASIGWWIWDVEQRQTVIMEERRGKLLERRRRFAEQEAAAV